MIRYLLSREVDINNENCNICPNACSKGDVDLVNYLLNLDINISRQNYQSWPQNRRILSNNFRLLELLCRSRVYYISNPPWIRSE